MILIFPNLEVDIDVQAGLSLSASYIIMHVLVISFYTVPKFSGQLSTPH